MNPVLSTQAFWQPYLTLEPGDLSDDDLAAQVEALRGDFVVIDKTITLGSGRRQRTIDYKIVEFTLSCGERFSFVLEYVPGVSGSEKSLVLLDAETGTKHQMGWWDLARWHPYCLRADELDMLLEFWQRWDDRWPSRELPLLLLCQFVGLADAADLQLLQAKAEAAYRSLNLPDNGGGKPNVPLQVPEQYRWERDEELGWVFTSDDYCCYSLRNRAHASSEEGHFPFAAFREMLAEVGRRCR